jgi:ribA/ribD-fused uncharacterized protein
MMAGKASLFQDSEALTRILLAEKPALAKNIGREVKGFDQSVWDRHAADIVVEGNYHKFSSNQALRTFLLQTGNKILVEASPSDAIWGIGLAKDHTNAANPAKWRGSNLLGFALMEVRDRIKNENNNGKGT